jgi:hypothetical protein
MNTHTPPEQASRDDPRIVEDQEFVASQETVEFGEQAVFENSRRSIQEQEPRGFAAVKRTLGDLLTRETIVKFIQAHGKRQSTSKAAKTSKTNKLASRGSVFSRDQTQTGQRVTF